MYAQTPTLVCAAPTDTAEQPAPPMLEPRPRRKSVRQATFLADASKRLAETLDLQRTLDSLVELSAPELGDACMVYLYPEGHSPGGLAAIKHADPTRTRLLRALSESAFNEPHGRRLILKLASTGRPAVLSQLATAALLGDGRPPHVLLTDLGLRTAALFPVAMDSTTLAIVVFLSNHGRFYTSKRVQLAQELVARFALALQAARMYALCKRSLDDVQESLATTIHDLMSPLTYIKGTAQRLGAVEISPRNSATDPDFAQRVKAIDSAANRMAEALTTLLETTRPIPMTMPRRRDHCTDLVALARNVVIAEQLSANQHPIHFSAAASALVGAWQPENIRRLLTNLISNAVKYSPPGSPVEVSLDFEADAEGRWAIVRVTDHGIGIPARDLPFVFEPFHRGSNIGSATGSGLGLASVLQIIKSYHGRIWIDSHEGKGTCVSVRLPVGDVRSS